MYLGCLPPTAAVLYYIYIIFPKRALAGNYNLFYNQPSFGEHWYHLQSIFVSNWQTNVDIKMIHKVYVH